MPAYGFKNGPGLFSSLCKVYVGKISLSNINIISSTIYTDKKYNLLLIIVNCTASTLLWPQGTRVYVSDQLADLILANRDYLHHVVTDALEQHIDTKPLYQASEHVKSTYAACVDAYQQLQDEPERLRGNLAHFGKMMSCTSISMIALPRLPASCHASQIVLASRTFDR